MNECRMSNVGESTIIQCPPRRQCNDFLTNYLLCRRSGSDLSITERAAVEGGVDVGEVRRLQNEKVEVGPSR